METISGMIILCWAGITAVSMLVWTGYLIIQDIRKNCNKKGD